MVHAARAPRHAEEKLKWKLLGNILERHGDVPYSSRENFLVAKSNHHLGLIARVELHLHHKAACQTFDDQITRVDVGRRPWTSVAGCYLYLLLRHY